MAVTSFACTSCGAVIRVTPATAGKTGPCPRCKAPVRAPAPGDDALSNTLAHTRAAPSVEEPDPLERERLALELERAKIDLERAAMVRARADPEWSRSTPSRGVQAISDAEADELDRLRAIERAQAAAHADERTCPDCAEWIKREALVCKHCGWGRPAQAPQVIVQQVPAGRSTKDTFFVLRQACGIIFLTLVVIFCLLPIVFR